MVAVPFQFEMQARWSKSMIVEAKNSPTGKPLMIVANEVTGNVRVFEINGR
jgi:hypothetical protein